MIAQSKLQEKNNTVISRNFARAIIVFKHGFTPALKWIRRQYESFQKLKYTWRLFISFRVQLGVKMDPALFWTRAILREVTVHKKVLLFDSDQGSGFFACHFYSNSNLDFKNVLYIGSD